VFVSVTRLRLRSVRVFPLFVIYSLRAAWQARRSQGHVVSHLNRDRHGAYWTRSIWTDEAAMRAFMMSGAHREAMPKLLDWCVEGAAVHWEQEHADPPSWREGHRRLLAEGRPSKVRHPSPAQRAFNYPAP
jgi:hypothetical protein